MEFQLERALRNFLPKINTNATPKLCNFTARNISSSTFMSSVLAVFNYCIYCNARFGFFLKFGA